MSESAKSETVASTTSDVVESESTESHRVPFTIEMMELDANPIVLQMKSY